MIWARSSASAIEQPRKTAERTSPQAQAAKNDWQEDRLDRPRNETRGVRARAATIHAETQVRNDDAAPRSIAYRVEEPQEVKRRPMAYSDNFKFNRVGPWTH